LDLPRRTTTNRFLSDAEPLQQLIQALEEQNVILGKARNDFLLLEAERKHFEAVLTVRAQGKSHNEKRTNAEACEDWLNFHLKLARARSVFEFQELKFSILEKEYQAVYLSQKSDQSLIKKQV